MTLDDQKRVELASKLQGLPLELAEWRRLSAEAGPLEKHHSQILRLAPQMEGLQQTVEEDLSAAVRAGQLLPKARQIELKLLAVHSVWDFFRRTFLMRAGGPFAGHLQAADAYLRACYEPMRGYHTQGRADALREPPLVTIQNDWSPSALPRNHSYSVAYTPGGWTDSEAVGKVIQALPVPIVTMPWSSAEHLPHQALLAHEAGHVVEEDLGLGARLDKAVADAQLKYASAWKAWRKEAFADWYGCAVGGPAFAWALMEVLAVSKSEISSQKPTEAEWGDYPTSTLRILLCAAALEGLGDKADADAITERWRKAYPDHAMKEYEDDASKIAQALKNAGVTPQKCRYGEVSAQSVEALQCLQLWRGFDRLPDATLKKLTDPRPLVDAASRLQRLEPERDQKDEWRSTRDQIVQSRPPGVLAGAAAKTAPPSEEDTAREHKAGAALAPTLFASLGDQ